jgi:hypothetical protein
MELTMLFFYITLLIFLIMLLIRRASVLSEMLSAKHISMSLFPRLRKSKTAFSSSEKGQTSRKCVYSA